VFNFSHWEVKVDPTYADRYVIEISEASPFCDVHLHGIEASMNRMSSRIGEKDLWRWERTSTETVVFRMARPI
jgi:hypothetical protein